MAVAEDVSVQYGAATVSVTGHVRVIGPPVAVRVAVYVPGMALEEAANVVITVPSPGAANEDLASVAVTPVGNPDHARLTAALNAPLCAVVVLKVVLPPCAMVKALCAPVNAKLSPVTATENGYALDE
jgi:hypothetical protein